MSITNGFAGVSNCYVFKSRLQEYAQKAGFLTPMYDTVKEGPSHQPCFRSTVIVDNVRYDSLLGFFNRKAAEQSAAEVALLALAKSGNLKESISYPVHETGLCKNLLQEYAQKMNYAIPCYTCRPSEAPGRKSLYSCTVEIGGITYVGAAASSKKDAEIKAARTALLAIQSQSHTNGAEAGPSDGRHLTVLPCKNKGAESDAKKEETGKPFKPKKTNFKKKLPRKRFLRKKANQTGGDVETCLGEHVGVEETNDSQNDQVISATQGNGVVQGANFGATDVSVVVGEYLATLNQNEEGKKAVEAETVLRIEESADFLLV